MSPLYDTLCIDHTPFETRAALLKDGKLICLYNERVGQTSTSAPVHIGDIFKGRIVNIVPSLQACFVDIGQGQNGFLPVNATAHDDIKSFHQGETILVQVKQPAKGDKGAVLSCKIELNGANTVLTPHRPGINISRKFQDADRRELFKATLCDLLPDDCGLVVRTHAENLPPETLAAEAQKLHQDWCSLTQTNDTTLGPVYQAEGFLTHLWNSLSTKDLQNIYVEGLEAAQNLQKLTNKAILHKGSTSLFEEHEIESQIEAALSPISPLPSGGHLVIEETQALIAIDINMAERTDNRSLDENWLRTNLDALEVMKEQIILRNLSGQILIDFINMKSKSDKNKLEDAARSLFKGTDCHFHGLTRLGLGEFSRPRLATSLSEQYRGPDASYAKLLRQLSHGGLHKTIPMGAALYNFWQDHPPHWLKDRLGFMPQAQLDKTLAPKAFSHEETKF
ncbi:MAG: ribonuclease E/G [Methylocystaceae bacterium]|nr:ribonuclease E/G [Methylocystaceae bacterium]